MKFADTSYFIGLLNPRDQLHEQALALSRNLDSKILTTRWVLLELANAMSSPPDREVFINFLRKVINTGIIEIVPANEDWFTIGLDFYRRRSDKEWSLTDCISFVVMQEHGLTKAMTADHHFAQAGFRVLLDN